MTLKWLKLLRPYLGGALLGALLTFAFAPYDIFPLAIIALAALLFLIKDATPKQALWMGFAFGLGYFGLGIYWVFISIHDIGGVPASLSTLITAGFVAILAVYPGFACYLTNRYFPTNNTTKFTCAFPAIWLVSEILRSSVFTGFPWLFLGYSQTNSPLKGYAPIFSVYGVSLAILVTSGLLVNVYIKYKQHRNFRALYVNLSILAAIWIGGNFLSLIPWTRADGKPITVALIQGNIPQTIKWSPEHLEFSIKRYVDLSAPYWGKTNLIIWPEAAVPIPLQDAQGFINSLHEKGKDTHTALLLGIPIKAKKISGYHNAVIAVGDVKTNQVYLKRHLVPFGEYTPFENLISNVFNFMQIPMSNMVPGIYNQPPIVVDNVPFNVNICYEIAFPELIRMRNMQTSVLLTVTNDAWFGDSSAQPQHIQMAQMRAMELGRSVLFVSNNGVTGIIGPTGRIEAALPQEQAAVLSGSVQPMYGITPWMKNGMDPILFTLICLFFSAFRTQRKVNKENQPQKAPSKITQGQPFKSAKKS